MTVKYLKRAILFTFIIGLALSGCKKNSTVEAAIDFPVTVYPSSSSVKAAMRMFAGGVEITDAAKITKFTASIPASQSGNDLLTKFPASYTFTSKDSIKFSANNNFFVAKTNDRYVITTISNSATNPLPAMGEVEKFFAFQTKAYAVANGYNITRQFAAYGDYSTFRVSVLNFKYRRATVSSPIIYGLVANEFDPATVIKLGAADTLAVQEYFIHYK